MTLAPRRSVSSVDKSCLPTRVGQAVKLGLGEGAMIDADYWSQRARQELEAAVKSSDRRVREIHLELAAAYSFRVRETNRQTGPAVMLKSETAA